MDGEPQQATGDRTPVVPAALRALRITVLGLAALLAVVGAVAFVRLPEPVDGLVDPESAAGAGGAGSTAAAGCLRGCLGQAGPLRTVDVLPAELTGVAVLEAVGPLPVTADAGVLVAAPTPAGTKNAGLGPDGQAEGKGDGGHGAKADRRSDAGRGHGGGSKDDDEEDGGSDGGDD